MMNTWAVIKTGGKQYKVEEGQSVVVEKLDGQKESKVSFDKVLAIGGDKLTVGTPTVEKAKVTGIIVDTFKGKKIRVVKFKPKSRYLRQTGARQQKSKVIIEKIRIAA